VGVAPYVEPLSALVGVASQDGTKTLTKSFHQGVAKPIAIFSAALESKTGLSYELSTCVNNCFEYLPLFQ
jgi:hypothetical protein